MAAAPAIVNMPKSSGSGTISQSKLIPPLTSSLGSGKSIKPRDAGDRVASAGSKVGVITDYKEKTFRFIFFMPDDISGCSLGLDEIKTKVAC